MSINFDFELEGLEDVLERVDSLAQKVKLEKALGKACALVERSAKEKAPKGITLSVQEIVPRVISTSLSFNCNSSDTRIPVAYNNSNIALSRLPL